MSSESRVLGGRFRRASEERLGQCLQRHYRIIVECHAVNGLAVFANGGIDEGGPVRKVQCAPCREFWAAESKGCFILAATKLGRTLHNYFEFLEELNLIFF
jgi:hypothetical protein